VQLRLTEHGTDVVLRAIAIVRSLQEELAAPIGGTQTVETASKVRRMRTLLGTRRPLVGSMSTRETMPEPSTLTGQAIREAEGAVRALLDQILAGTATTSNEYIAMRILSLRGPAALHESLAGNGSSGSTRQRSPNCSAGWRREGSSVGALLMIRDPHS
jgi:hypothetical protein